MIASRTSVPRSAASSGEFPKTISVMIEKRFGNQLHGRVSLRFEGSM